MSGFSPPEQFDFTSPEHWPLWRDRFKRYRQASKLSMDEEETQVSALVYAMGPEAEHIILSIEAFPHDDFEAAVQCYDGYFTPKRNVIAERHAFEVRTQGPTESNESYIRAVHCLAEHCQFADKNERIRDRIIAGMRDKNMSKQIQLRALDSDVTLEVVVQMLRNHDLVHDPSTTSNVNRVERGARYKPPPARRPTSSQPGMAARRSQLEPASSRARPSCGRGGRGSQHSTTCRYCGRRRHASPQQCPALGKTCFKCGGRDHFANVCSGSSHRIQSVQCAHDTDHEDDQEEGYFLGMVEENTNKDRVASVEGSRNKEWTVSVEVGQNQVSFKVDSGADVNVLSLQQYEQMVQKPDLLPTSRQLSSVGGALEVLGVFSAAIKYKQVSLENEHFYVLDTSQNLLSRSTGERLGVIEFTGEVRLSQNVFGATGLMNTSPIKIRLVDDAVPSAVHTARNVPFPLLKSVKQELDRMEDAGIIRSVSEPTDWCAPMVPVPKSSGSVRITVDYKNLNKCVKREIHPIPTVEQLTAELAGSSIYSKLDASSGFYQLPLDVESQLLTTFITPFGRKAFQRLPMGINLAPECFQKKMQEMLAGLDGVLIYMDDIVVYGDSVTHDERLQAVLQRIESSGLKLNKAKCEFKKDSIVFLGQKISSRGVEPDPAKLAAVRELQAPQNEQELRSLLGTINYLGKFVPQIQSKLKPLNDLLKKDVTWLWSHVQQNALDEVKQMLTGAPVLAFYDPTRETIVSADASSYGIGGCVLQRQPDSHLRPVAFCSRTLTPCEQRYAQIEKELLAAVWTCERMHMLLSGLPQFRLELDHKPLVPLINSKSLIDTPVRCQILLMRLTRYNPVAIYVPGKQHVVPDYLSRHPCKETDNVATVLQNDVSDYVSGVIGSLPVSDHRLEEIRMLQERDDDICRVTQQTLHGWMEGPRALEDYFSVRHDLSVVHLSSGPLLLYRNRLVVPQSIRSEMLNKLHNDGHFGLSKCRQRADQSVWWPGISEDLKRHVSQCQFCQINSPQQHRETLIPTPVPSSVWSHIACDICHYNGYDYLVTVDLLSRYLEIQRLTRLTSSTVVERLKTLFARHGIPDIVTSDGGTQFTSHVFQSLSTEYGFQHRVTDPHTPSSNGAAERAVRTAKWILRQRDPHLALLNYRATPVEATGQSPARLLFGREIQTRLPRPRVIEGQDSTLEAARRRDGERKQRSQESFNKHHGARDLPPLRPGDVVRVRTRIDPDWRERATVRDRVSRRSYVVSNEQHVVRRNRGALRLSPGTELPGASDSPLPAGEARPSPDALNPPVSVSARQTPTVLVPAASPLRRLPEPCPHVSESPSRTRSGKMYGSRL